MRDYGRWEDGVSSFRTSPEADCEERGCVHTETFLSLPVVIDVPEGVLL